MAQVCKSWNVFCVTLRAFSWHKNSFSSFPVQHAKIIRKKKPDTLEATPSSRCPRQAIAGSQRGAFVVDMKPPCEQPTPFSPYWSHRFKHVASKFSCRDFKLNSVGTMSTPLSFRLAANYSCNLRSCRPRPRWNGTSCTNTCSEATTAPTTTDRSSSSNKMARLRDAATRLFVSNETLRRITSY